LAISLQNLKSERENSVKMRRAAGQYGQYPNYTGRSDTALEGENDQLTDELKDKIHSLKTLSIDIGNEVKDHNHFLSGMDDDFDNAGGFLGKAMKGVKRLSKGSQNYITIYLFFFALFVFFVLWMLLKFAG